MIHQEKNMQTVAGPRDNIYILGGNKNIQKTIIRTNYEGLIWQCTNFDGVFLLHENPVTKRKVQKREKHIHFQKLIDEWRERLQTPALLIETKR